MPAPIKLGSAAGASLVFEKGSRVTTSDSGIQTCAVQAIYGNAANVFAVIPLAGTAFGDVFGNAYLPASFKADITDTGPEIEYLEGNAARITIEFKRLDPNRVPGRGGAKISVDSAINYKSILSGWGTAAISASTGARPDVFGFPEPIVTVKYGNPTQPPIAAALYAQPGTPRAAGFPSLTDINVPIDFTVPNGTVVSYFDGTAYQNFTAVGTTAFHFQEVFKSNPLGWQLEKLKYDALSGFTLYDVEETWRGSYFFSFVRLLSHGPP